MDFVSVTSLLMDPEAESNDSAECRTAGMRLSGTVHALIYQDTRPWRLHQQPTSVQQQLHHAKVACLRRQHQQCATAAVAAGQPRARLRQPPHDLHVVGAAPVLGCRHKGETQANTSGTHSAGA